MRNPKMYTSLKSAFVTATKWLNMFLFNTKSMESMNNSIMEIGGQDYVFEETSDEWIWTHVDAPESSERVNDIERQQRLWFNWNLAGSDRDEEKG